MVEWKKLGEIATVSNGERPVSDILKTGMFPYINAGRTNSGYLNECNSIRGAVTTPSHGEGGIGSVMFHDYDFWCGALCYKMYTKDGVINRYLYHYLCNNTEKILNCKNVGGQPYINRKQLENIKIEVLSLSEQERIVGILDTFTSSIENLKAQISLRRKQYEHYRDKLLDLEGKEGVEMKTISEVARSFTGLTYKPENVCDTGTLVLRSSNIDEDNLVFDDNVYVQMDIPERAIVRENDLLICVRNGSKRLVGKSAMITKAAEGMAFGAFMTILRSTNVDSKYLFYAWQSEKVKKQHKGDDAMPIAQITAKDFQRISIPLPSLEEQSRIVSILDEFEASIKNLEAQLEAREKQYEYYREKLLTFERE